MTRNLQLLIKGRAVSDPPLPIITHLSFLAITNSGTRFANYTHRPSMFGAIACVTIFGFFSVVIVGAICTVPRLIDSHIIHPSSRPPTTILSAVRPAAPSSFAIGVGHSGFGVGVAAAKTLKTTVAGIAIADLLRRRC